MYVCLWLQCLLSLMMLVSKDVYQLINYTSFVESLFMGFSVAGLLYLRYKMPDMPRPIKVSYALTNQSKLCPDQSK